MKYAAGGKRPIPSPRLLKASDGRHPCAIMQGSFRPNADWEAVLDPGPDEDALAENRKRRAQQAVARAVAIRRNIAVPVQPDVPDPVAADISFTVKDLLFYVLKGDNADAPPQPGQFGHYLVTYMVDATTRFASPFLTQDQPLPEFVPAPVAPAGGGPAPAGGGGGAGPAPAAQPALLPAPAHEPGMPGMGDDTRPRPNLHYCKEGRDFIRADPHKFWEIGISTLKNCLEKAEAMDFAFAKRMEGFGNVAPSVVWDCLDPYYDPSDRKAVMDQFMAKYLNRFYTRADACSNEPDAQSLSEEALHKHKTFCQAWTKKHYRCLTQAVTAPAEALAGEFHEDLVGGSAQQHRLTRLELSRVLMRHQDVAPEFASCLHYFMTNLEQSRGGRNASYKQMSAVNSSKAWSYNRLGNLLGEHGAALARIFRGLADEGRARFDPFIIDWYAILGQMPQVHRYFNDSQTSAGPGGGAAGGRRAAGQGQVPPWRVGRQ
jgi:hypothetical protein